MPIIKRHDNPGDLLELAHSAGREVGKQRAFERQQAIDQSFIQQAIAASRERSMRPSFYEQRKAEHRRSADRADARASQQDALQAELARLDAGRDVELAKLDARNAEIQGQLELDAQKAQMAQRTQASRAAMAREAMQGGPEAFAAFLAADQFAQSESVPVGVLEQMFPERKAGRQETDKRTNFQRQVGDQIDKGGIGNVLGYLDDRQQIGDGMSMGVEGPLSGKALEMLNELERQTQNMDSAELTTLRQAVVSDPNASAGARAHALMVTDRAIAQRKQQRDVEIGMVYENVMRQATDQIVAGYTGPDAPASLDRATMRTEIGRRALEAAEQYGIAREELYDWIGRMNAGY